MLFRQNLATICKDGPEQRKLFISESIFKLSLFETSESAYKFRGLYVLLNGLLLKDNYKNMFLSSAKLL